MQQQSSVLSIWKNNLAVCSYLSVMKQQTIRPNSIIPHDETETRLSGKSQTYLSRQDHNVIRLKTYRQIILKGHSVTKWNTNNCVIYA